MDITLWTDPAPTFILDHRHHLRIENGVIRTQQQRGPALGQLIGNVVNAKIK
jgi:hypothetical protein